MNPNDHNIFIILDSLPPRAIKTWIKRHDDLLDYTAEHYAYFSQRRSQLIDELKQALSANTVPFEFKNWKRIVSQEFSNTPLHTVGSIKSYPGGRFNIGEIDSKRFPKFPALYMAEDTKTAYVEMMGISPDMGSDGLTGNELAVAVNFSHFIISGNLTSILDLTNPKSLQQFYSQIKQIKLPIYFKNRAAKLKISQMQPVESLEKLRKTIFAEDWRLMPMQFDSPANSQIIGQIAHSAGIEGILYPSVKTNKRAIAIYPENFINSEAFVEIKGNVADTVRDKKIDKNTYKKYLP